MSISSVAKAQLRYQILAQQKAEQDYKKQLEQQKLAETFYSNIGKIELLNDIIQKQKPETVEIMTESPKQSSNINWIMILAGAGLLLWLLAKK